MTDKEKFFEISKRIGYKVGTYCNDEEIEVFEKILEDYKYKNNLIEKQQEEIESWKKYSNEQEESIVEKNNKICDLEFKIQTQQKEIERQKNMYNHLSKDNTKVVNYTFELNAEIENKDKELEKYINLLATQDIEHIKEREKKDKIIDKLIDALMSHDEHFNYCDKKLHKKHDGNCKSCLKEYFINKVEKESKDGNGM